MKLAMRLESSPSPRWELAKQTGVDYGVMNLPKPDRPDIPIIDRETTWDSQRISNLSEEEKPWGLDHLKRMKESADNEGITPLVIEERPPMDRIRLGIDGRDEEIEYVCELLRNMGEVGIPIWCWVWRTHFPVIRTGNVTERGGSKTTAYNHTHLDAYLDGNPRAKSPPSVSEEELWENLQYFLDQVVPVAEEAGVKMALHPDDPPIDSTIAEVPRIIRSVEGYDRALEMYPSEYNGITFGQGNFAAMGADIPETIRHFKDHIHFIHFRDVQGKSPADFRETWHDNGPTDMFKAIQTYRDVGFDGPIRPDHFPLVTAGKENQNNEEGLKGRLFAIGYMKGLIDKSKGEN